MITFNEHQREKEREKKREREREKRERTMLELFETSTFCRRRGEVTDEYEHDSNYHVNTSHVSDEVSNTIQYK